MDDVHRLRPEALRAYEAARRANGAVSIDLPEASVRVNGGEVSIHPVLPLASRHMVENAMVMTGEAVALDMPAASLGLRALSGLLDVLFSVLFTWTMIMVLLIPFAPNLDEATLAAVTVMCPPFSAEMMNLSTHLPRSCCKYSTEEKPISPKAVRLRRIFPIVSA